MRMGKDVLGLLLILILLFGNVSAYPVMGEGSKLCLRGAHYVAT